MSIRERIKQHVASGELVHAPHSLPSVRAGRYLFMVKEMWEAVDGSLSGNGIHDLRLGKLRADFDRFVSGQELTIGDHPLDKGINAFMARTHPVQDGVFDIRSQDPSPGIRVFGCFSEKNTFIALIWRCRKDLGSRNERAFDQAILAAQREWNRLFDPLKPLYSEDIHDHLSTKIRIV
jgi:hypothetical protein